MRLYNTLTRQKQEFTSLKDRQVGIYSCGPTVYWNQHIGHMYAYVHWDALVRTLKYLDYQVKWVMNITDVGHLTSDGDTGEDKMEKGARREGLTVWEIAAKYTQQFLGSLDLLHINRPDVLCKATDHLPEQIDLIKKIKANGFTYPTPTGLVFDTSKFPDYAQFARLNLRKQQTGSRGQVDPQKKRPWDFFLWKFDAPPQGFPQRQMDWWFDGPLAGQPLIPPPQGPQQKQQGLKNWQAAQPEHRATVGFPGWHIECTAMSTKYLGSRFDIHTGGVEHIPVHHTNEIAQGYAAFGHQTANFWLHNSWLTLKGEKMSKSLGNMYTVADLVDKGFDPLAFRYLVFTSHYRHGLNFTWQALSGAATALEKLRRQLLQAKRAGESQSQRTVLSSDKLTKVHHWQQKFTAHLQDDLDLPGALATVHQMLGSNIPQYDKADLLLDWDQILGFNLSQVDSAKPLQIPPEVQKLVDRRRQLRQQKKFAQADQLRRQIEDQGFSIEDTPGGSSIKKNLTPSRC